MQFPKLRTIKESLKTKNRAALIGAGVLILSGALLSAGIFLFPAKYEIPEILGSVSLTGEKTEEAPQKIKITHLPTPEPLKAIYMTSWVAGTPKWRAELTNLIDTTELNALVIDVKDYSGRLSFKTENSFLNELGVSEARIPDIREFIADLHKKDIYVIGRITVFQDPFFAENRPDLAVQKESDKTLWADYKGLHYMDPGATEVWDYTVLIAKET